MSAFPKGFLWGTATSAHQTEGGNVNNDWWVREHDAHSPCVEPSGDACDSFHRYNDDIALVRDFGLNSYRFSLEWSRIEPEPGEFSQSAIAHYRRMIDSCLDAGLAPNVTLTHFTLPRWFDERGGWAAPDASERFLRYSETLEPILRDVPYVCTINEPNIASSFSRLRHRSDHVSVGLPAPDPEVSQGEIDAHHRVVELVQSWGGPAVGWAVATLCVTPTPGGESAAAAYAEPRETVFLKAAANDDWLGVQAYTRQFVGPEGPLPVSDNVEKTLMGWEYFPQAAELGLREAARHTPGVPLIVTENGIATDDDTRRIDYITAAIDGVSRAASDGIDIRGYYYWSLLDNYEWASGYKPTFGLAGVDRQTFARIPRPSGYQLGTYAGLLTP